MQAWARSVALPRAALKPDPAHARHAQTAPLGRLRMGAFRTQARSYRKTAQKTEGKRPHMLAAWELLLLPANTEEDEMRHQMKTKHERQSGKVLVPALLWFAGVPFTVVVLLWLLFFRG